jgi:ankyrin repeat protein
MRSWIIYLTAVAIVTHAADSPSESASDLYRAVQANDAQKVSERLQSGDDPNVKTPWGWTPLHQATYTSVQIVRLLLSHGASIDATSDGTSAKPGNQWSPLFYAVYNGKDDIVEELISQGATVSRRDRWGRTPIDYARERRFSKIEARLLQAIRDATSKKPNKHAN